MFDFVGVLVGDDLVMRGGDLRRKCHDRILEERNGSAEIEGSVMLSVRPWILCLIDQRPTHSDPGIGDNSPDAGL